ncbi:MAG TPA: DUF3047 domain-containing protein [Nitrospirota bacterium]
MTIKTGILSIRLRPAVFLAVILIASAIAAQEKKTLFHDDFATLGNWKPFFFPGIQRHSLYTSEKEGDRSVLKAESHASASAIVYRDSFNVYDYPKMRWRWKVMNVYAKGDPRTKEGDDYPLRIYIMFEYDPQKAGIFEKLKYGLAKKRYGTYPPHSSLSYVWASREEPQAVLASPYTDKAKMILLEQGTKKTGTWQDEEVDILADYRRAFGAEPPPRARVAIMNDSDNTGESSVSYLEFIEVFR